MKEKAHHTNHHDNIIILDHKAATHRRYFCDNIATYDGDDDSTWAALKSQSHTSSLTKIIKNMNLSKSCKKTDHGNRNQTEEMMMMMHCGKKKLFMCECLMHHHRHHQEYREDYNNRKKEENMNNATSSYDEYLSSFSPEIHLLSQASPILKCITFIFGTCWIYCKNCSKILCAHMHFYMWTFYECFFLRLVLLLVIVASLVIISNRLQCRRRYKFWINFLSNGECEPASYFFLGKQTLFDS